MQQHVRIRHLSKAAQSGLEALVAALAREHIERHVKPSDAATAGLFATLEKFPPRQLFRATLRLELPGRALLSRAEDGDIEAAILSAFEELETRLRRHLSRLRHREPEPREQRLPRLEQRLPERSQAEQAAYFDQVAEELAELTSFVQRELIYLQSNGDLASDYPTVDDVVDEVLVRALDRWQSGMEAPTFARALLMLSIEVLAELVAEARTELLNGLALDDSDEIDPAQTLYYQEQLAESQTEPSVFESMMPAAGPDDPAQAADFDKIRRLVLESLRRLPVSWRRIVMLRRMDGQPTRTVAATLGIDEHTVETCLEHVDAFLRDRLRQAEIDLDDRAAPADYLVIDGPFSTAAPEIERELVRLMATAGSPDS